MSRITNATVISNLSQATYVSEILIEITTSTTSYYYTTGHSNVTCTTTTVTSSHTFNATNQVSIVGNMVESYDPSQGDFVLQLDTTDTTLITDLTTNFLKTRITAYKMFRDNTTNVADTTNLIQIYDSYATDAVVQGGQNGISIQMKSRTVFNGLRTKKGRTNADLEPATGINIVWGSIQWQTQ